MKNKNAADAPIRKAGVGSSTIEPDAVETYSTSTPPIKELLHASMDGKGNISIATTSPRREIDIEDLIKKLPISVKHYETNDNAVIKWDGDYQEILGDRDEAHSLIRGIVKAILSIFPNIQMANGEMVKKRYVLIHRKGKIPDKKNPMQNTHEGVIILLKEIFECYPDVSCTVIEVVYDDDIWASDGREYLSIAEHATAPIKG